jgi:hypothetical protein
VSSVLLAHRPAASLYSISLVATLLRVERKKNEMGTRVRCVIDLTNVESINAHCIEIYSDLFEIKSLRWGIILQSKKYFLIRNYLAE